MPKTAPSDKPIAVLIDAENVLQPKLMYRLLRELGQLGVVGLKRVYGNAAAISKWTSEAMEFGIEPHQTPSSNRKNATDFALTIDALDLMHSGKFSAFCIVSSDGDFLPLAQRIRAEGLAVYGCGEDKKTTQHREAYAEFFTVESLLKEKAARKTVSSIAAAPKPAAKLSKAIPTKEVLDNVCEIVTAAGGAKQAISLVSLGQRLARDYPAFKFKSYNHATLGKFLLAHSDLFECIEKSGNGVTHVRLRK